MCGFNVFSVYFTHLPLAPIPVNDGNEAACPCWNVLEGWRFISVGLASVHEKGHDVAVGELGCFWSVGFDGIDFLNLCHGVFQSVGPAAVVVKVMDPLADCLAVGASFF